MDKLKVTIMDFLRSQHLMSLATLGENIDNCTVYYAPDDKFNLYFISEPDSNHCQNIAKNSSVAAAIADSTQKVTDKKRGLQFEGTASVIQDEKKIEEALRLWNKSNPGFAQIINYENMKNKKIKGKMYKVTPVTIKFFNEQLYGPEGFRIIKF